jgi:hypothetical protein
MLEREGLPGSLYPIAVLVDEGLDLFGPRTAWHDDLDAPARIDLDGQAPCPGAFTNVKARLRAGLVVFREQ